MTVSPSSLSLETVRVTPFRQNCSILWERHTRHAVIFDPGGDVAAIMGVIKEHHLIVDKILITHGHLDHAGGASALMRDLAAYQQTQPQLIGPERGDGFLLSSIERQAAFFHWTDPKNVNVERFAKPGEEISCLGHPFKVVHVPGHTPGHVAYVSKDLKIAFVGDIIFHDTVGRTDFSYGDHAMLIDGIKRNLLPMGDEIVMVPGHGRFSTFGEERQHNPRLKEI